MGEVKSEVGEGSTCYLTRREAAAYLRLSHRTLDAWATQGVGPLFLKLGSRRTLYRRDDLERWLEAERGREARARVEKRVHA